MRFVPVAIVLLLAGSAMNPPWEDFLLDSESITELRWLYTTDRAAYVARMAELYGRERN